MSKYPVLTRYVPTIIYYLSVISAWLNKCAFEKKIMPFKYNKNEIKFSKLR